eukprot:m.993200 g.993200  ORF g.993200 m.993200 type:complete len:55 (+) comp24010_c0_seq2:120-284(+)
MTLLVENQCAQIVVQPSDRSFPHVHKLSCNRTIVSTHDHSRTTVLLQRTRGDMG